MSNKLPGDANAASPGARELLAESSVLEFQAVPRKRGEGCPVQGTATLGQAGCVWHPWEGRVAVGTGSPLHILQRVNAEPTWSGP